MEQMQAIDGRVTAVRGAVLDVAFEGATLPPIDDALLITPEKGAPIIAEVQSHLDEATSPRDRFAIAKAAARRSASSAKAT